MKIAYKIVYKKSRMSPCAPGKYCLKYDKDNIISSPSGTLGIFCFKTRSYAQETIDLELISHKQDDLIIIRVEPIGRGKTPPILVAPLFENNFDMYYKSCGLKDNNLCDFPGSICFESVRVLD